MGCRIRTIVGNFVEGEGGLQDMRVLHAGVWRQEDRGRRMENGVYSAEAQWDAASGS